MKTTVKKVTDAYAFLDKAKYTKMEAADRRKLIKGIYRMKKVSAEYNDFRNDALKRLRPDNAEEMATLLSELDRMKPEEQMNALSQQKYADALRANAEFNKAVGECLGEELEKEVELDFLPLTEEAFDRLLDSNPEWSVGQAMLAEEILCDSDK